ncbi:MAG TPA: MFS transporter [Caulobacteraceae bacterium]
MSTFYVLLATQALSMIGSRTSGLAVGIAVFRLTGHATPLALVSVCSMAPWIVLGGVGGALADRFDRRTLMLAANVGYTLSSGLLLLAFLSGHFQLWQLYAITLASGVCGVVETPALQASVAMLVPDKHRDRANAIQQLSYPAAVAVAAGFAGVLYAAVGVVGAIVVDLGTFIAAMAVLAVVQVPMPKASRSGADAAGRWWLQPVFGFRYLAGRPALLALCIYTGAIVAFASGFWALTTPYVLDRVHATRTLGFVIATGMIGGIVGSLVMGAWGGTRPRIHTVMLSTVASGAFMMLAGAARSPVALGATMFLMSVSIPFANVAMRSIFQAKVPPELQGRVFAAMGQLNALLSPIGSLAAGPLADRLFEPAVSRQGWKAVGWLVGNAPGAGIGLLFVFAGLAIMATSLAAWALPAIRHLEANLPDHAAEPTQAIPEPSP